MGGTLRIRQNRGVTGSGHLVDMVLVRFKYYNTTLSPTTYTLKLQQKLRPLTLGTVGCGNIIRAYISSNVGPRWDWTAQAISRWVYHRQSIGILPFPSWPCGCSRGCLHAVSSPRGLPPFACECSSPPPISREFASQHTQFRSGPMVDSKIKPCL